MRYLIITFLIIYSNLFSEWIKDGDLEYIETGFQKISHFRYSIDTTSLLIHNKDSLLYIDKYTGKHIDTYIILNADSLHFELQEAFLSFIIFKNLSIDEKLWNYQFIYDIKNDYRTLGYLLINKDNSEIYFKRFTNQDPPPTYSSGWHDANFYFDKSGDRFIFSYFGYNERESEGGRSGSGTSFTKNITIPSAKRIENIFPDHRFNEHNFDIMFPFKGNLIRHGKFDNIFFPLPILSYCFANNETDVFLQKTFKKIDDINLNYNYIINCENFDTTYIYSTSNFGKIYYLKNNYFVSQPNSKSFNLVNGENFKIINKFNLDFDVQSSVYDSTNNYIYLLSGSRIYKRKIDFEPFNNSIPVFVSKSDVDDSVEFYDASEGIYDNVLWDFGDGNFSTDFHPVHSYNSTGTFTVTLSLFNKSEFQTKTSKNIYIYNKIVPDFEYLTISDSKPYLIYLKNKTKGDFISLKWYLNGKEISTEEEFQLSLNTIVDNNIKLEIKDENSTEHIEKDITFFTESFENDTKYITNIKNETLKINFFPSNNKFIYSYLFKFDHNRNHPLYFYFDGVHYGIVDIDNNFLDTNSILRTKKLNERDYRDSKDIGDRGHLFLNDFLDMNVLYYKNQLKLFEVANYCLYEFWMYQDRLILDCYLESKSQSISVSNIIDKKKFIEKVSDDFRHSRSAKIIFFNIDESIFVYIDQNLYTFDDDSNEFFKFHYFEYYLKNLFHINSEALTYQMINELTRFNFEDNSYNTIKIDNFEIINAVLTTDYIGLYGLKDKLPTLYIINRESFEILKTITPTIEKINFIEIDYINNLFILFGSNNNNLAYEIIDIKGNYLKEYFNTAGEFKNAKLNYSNEFLAQVKFEYIENKNYIFTFILENYLSVDKQVNNLDFIGNVILLPNTPSNLDIYDLLGRVIISKKNYLNKTYDFSELKSGFYLFRVTSNGEIYSGKFLKN